MEEKYILSTNKKDSSSIWLFFLFMFAPFLEDFFKERIVSKELREFCEKYNMDAEEIGKHIDEIKPIIERDYNRVKDEFNSYMKENKL